MSKPIILILTFCFLGRVAAFTPLVLSDPFSKRSAVRSEQKRSHIQVSAKEGTEQKQQHDHVSSTKEKTPIILLSGFLGTGKTTALKHLLENTDGSKIGVIVNDVASVNIDAKLVSSMPGSSGSEDMIELQNGCACCSLSDELFTSVENLFQPKKNSKNEQRRKYDAIVVELSGVADPMAIAATWRAATQTEQFAATTMAQISKVVTMIDATTFGTDYMTWDAASQRPGWVETGDDCAGNRKVAELLAEQVEAANLILVNKVDLAASEEVQVASKIARGLNSHAVIHEVQYGKVSPREILGLGTTGVKTGPMENVQEEESQTIQKEHEHEHSHSHGEDCSEPGCTDPSHSHSHNHDHAAHDEETGTITCIDPGCNDTSHSHSHSHATTTDNLGITNFVYKAARPFDMTRLMVLLNTWPVPVKDTLDLETLKAAQEEGYQVEGNVGQESPFVGVLRSKGFCWVAPSRWAGPAQDAYRHDTAMYWSHAGKSFGLGANGKWWSSIQIFEGWEAYMKRLFHDNMEEYERILRDDFVSEEFGDRRQELVFIGIGFDKDKITKELDGCLLTDAELEKYRQNLKNYQDTVLSLNNGGKGLFDMEGSVEHTEV